MNQYIEERINKIEDNVYILHDKIAELSIVVELQKKMLDDLFVSLSEMESSK